MGNPNCEVQIPRIDEIIRELNIRLEALALVKIELSMTASRINNLDDEETKCSNILTKEPCTLVDKLEDVSLKINKIGMELDIISNHLKRNI